MRLEELGDYIENGRRRFLEEMLSSALASTWHRRAEMFEDAIPRADDFTGYATPEEIEARRWRCAEIAQACRGHAELMLGGRL